MSQCAQEFLVYIQSLGDVIKKPTSMAISKLIHDYIPDDKEKNMRKMVQAINLNLVIAI